MATTNVAKLSVAEMDQYRSIYVGRSDGQIETGSGRDKERNEPTPEQLDNTPDEKGVVDYYKKLGEKDPKTLDWKRKLGGMLMRELKATETQDKGWVLRNFPENFRLYEHQKYTVSKDEAGQPSTTGRRNARGPLDRQDAYLYGHRLGRKKRYRSPADFFPHLLWLVTDETGDQGNCTCKICQPEDVAFTELAKLDKKKSESVPSAGSPGRTNSVEQAAGRMEASKDRPAVGSSSKALPKTSGSTKKRTLSQDTPNLGVNPSSVPAPRPSPKPTALPRARPGEQEDDARPGQYLFRIGELVWFCRGPSWGLSIVSRRGTVSTTTPYTLPLQPHKFNVQQAQYLVQPLSYPFNSHPPQSIESDFNLRPFLAWSVPPLTHVALQSLEPTLNSIDWSAVLAGRYGDGDADVDGSILAAQAIENSYVPIEPIADISNAAPGEKHYNGLFLGAEKIWTGDPIRLRTGSGFDLLIVQSIIERSGTLSHLNGGSTPGELLLVGDVYTFTTTNHTHHPSLSFPSAGDSAFLPRRLIVDLEFRNAVTLPAHGTMGQWKLVQGLKRVSLADVKGRWYESRLLLPILNGDERFKEELGKGVCGDAAVGMNERLKAEGAGDRVGTRVRSRREALGMGVPEGWDVGM